MGLVGLVPLCFPGASRGSQCPSPNCLIFRPALRIAMRTDIEVDVTAQGDAGLQARVTAAGIICAWESAREMASRESALKVEARVLQTQRPVTVLERSAMRRAYEALHGAIPDSECPSADYIASKMEETEQEEPSASPLDEVASIMDLDSQSLGAVLDASGQIRIRKSKVKGQLPSSSEELRVKLRLECNVWAFLSTKFTAKTWLRNVSPAKWQRYADYILGDKVCNLKIPCLQGDAMQDVRPAWNVVLHYEWEIRKSAMRAAREGGTPIDEALTNAMSNAELKECHFTSPLALMGRGSGAAKRPSEWTWPSKAEKKAAKVAAAGKADKGREPKGRGKVQGKEPKGKGKGKGAKGLVSLTADMRQICFAYSDPEGCKTPACGRLHICRVKGCGAAHPTYEHPA